MVTANDLSAWKDFPKGLRVLLLEGDGNSATDIRLQLEAMDYVVSTFCNENEALTAITDRPGNFHVAIVEVSTSNSNGKFKFLEIAKGLPIIMISNIHCLSTMMKCVALGAVEFLQKPLSEDKLRNIWQHVVHKAFNAGETALSHSLQPVKDSVASMLQVKVESEESKDEILEKTENVSLANENDHEHSPAIDKYPAPSTPQLKQGPLLLDDGDCQDHMNCSTEKESGEPLGESKSVETNCTGADVTLQEGHRQSLRDTVIKEEYSGDGVKSDVNNCSHPEVNESLKNPSCFDENPSKASGLRNSSGNKTNRKKMKVDWMPELHKKFVQVVEQLGVDQAIPSRILELMKVEGLTRHNVASHLQKYRMHRRNIPPKEDDGRWPPQKEQVQRSSRQHRPIMAYPPYHFNHAFSPSPLYPMWGTHQAGVQMWGPPGYPVWPPTESWHWKPYTAMHADAWGCPVMPSPHSPYSSSIPQNGSEFHGVALVDSSSGMPQNFFELHPAEEVIDKVVKEAISNPWLPLPLGLKPPSIDSVLAELSRQGISTIPPLVNGSNFS